LRTAHEPILFDVHGPAGDEAGFEGLELPPEIQEQDVPLETEVWFHMSD
jgi:hypothetical protein